MIELLGKIKTINKDNYEAEVELSNKGMMICSALRFENEPNEGDEVLIFTDEFKSRGIYIPLKILHTEDFVGIARSGYKLEFTKDGEIKLFNKYSKITIKDKDIKIDTGSGKIELSSDSIKVSGNVTITGGSLTTNGNVSPTGSGAFCGIKICPFTGAPHVGNKVQGT